MLGKTFGVLSLFALAFALLTGRTEEVSNAVLDGASAAVQLTVSLMGIMCLWNGVMQVLEDAGIIGKLARLWRPLLRVFFPDTYRDCGEELSANISANLLGIGNAATPLALSALEKMKKSAKGDSLPTRDMITLAVMNTASFSILPTTILSLRRAAGSENPFSVVAPIWICSFVCWLIALCLSRAAGEAYHQTKKRRKEDGKYVD